MNWGFEAAQGIVWSLRIVCCVMAAFLLLDAFHDHNDNDPDGFA